MTWWNEGEKLTKLEREMVINHVKECDRLFDNGRGLADKCLAYDTMRRLALELYDRAK